MSEKISWLDYLRALACMLVVLLHTAAPYLYQMNTISMYSWGVGNVVDSFARVCIPLFLMISGYLFFHDRKPGLRHYIRIILALLFYSGLALLYLKFYRELPVEALIRNILFAPVFYHLWYFYAIFAVYVLAGLITVGNTGLRSIIVLFILCFVILNPRLSDITTLFGVTLSSGFQIDGNIIYYALYAAFGAILGRLEIKNSSAVAYLALSCYVGSSLLIALLTFISSSKAGTFVANFYEYNGVLVSIGSISVFLFVKEKEKIFSAIEKPLNVIAGNSLAIYGTHVLVLDYINMSGYRNLESPIVDILLVFSAVFLSSLVVSYFIGKLDKYNWVS